MGFARDDGQHWCDNHAVRTDNSTPDQRSGAFLAECRRERELRAACDHEAWGWITVTTRHPDPGMVGQRYVEHGNSSARWAAGITDQAVERAAGAGDREAARVLSAALRAAGKWFEATVVLAASDAE